MRVAMIARVMRRHRREILLVAIAALLLPALAPSAHAGFIETIGFSPREAAMGGAATGVADDASAWYYNPAGLGQLQYDIQHL